MSGHKTRRFTRSNRDKNQHITAFDNEILMDENTGELLIKTLARDSLSYDYFQRFNQFTDELIAYGADRSLTGDMYRINPSDNIMLPAIIESGRELLDNPIDFIGRIRRFSLSADIDHIKKGDEFNPYNSPKGDFTFTFTYSAYYCNRTLYTDTVTVNMSNMMTNIINIPIEYSDITKITIDSIIINGVNTFDVSTDKLILNSIILYIDYEKFTDDIGIVIATPPTKTEYSSDATEIDMTGAVVYLYDMNHEPHEITSDEYTVEGWIQGTSLSSIELDVVYKGMSDSFTVYVINNTWLYIISNNEVTITRYIGTDMDVIIPATIEGYPVTVIDATTFNYTNITSVTIPDGVKEIR